MLLIRLNFHQLAMDHSDSSVQHLLVHVFCCTDHADVSRVETFHATAFPRSRLDLLLHRLHGRIRSQVSVSTSLPQSFHSGQSTELYDFLQHVLASSVASFEPLVVPSRFPTYVSLFNSIVCRSHAPVTHQHQVFPAIIENLSHF